MADIFYREIVISFLLTFFVNIAKCHISPEISSEEYDSLNPRRDMHEDDEGIPIEFGNEISNDVKPVMEIKLTTQQPIETTTTKEAVYPPLSRRYRRIYNPDEVASIEEYPFMAALLVNGELWCGGVIIDTDKVLTAAHCLQLQYNNRFFHEYVKMLTVRVGSTNATAGGEVLRVSEIFFHPNYKPQTLEFNFAVVKLHRNLTFRSRDSLIKEIPYSTDKIIPVENEILFLGWGSVVGVAGKGGAVLLQKVKLPVYDTSDCQDIYGRELVTRNNFCAGYITIPKNVCNHDAGGPAILNNVLIGILSFSSKRCDTPDHPAVFSTVGTIAEWLENIGDRRMLIRDTVIPSERI